jgi:hypothetical protein
MIETVISVALLMGIVLGGTVLIARTIIWAAKRTEE